MPSLAYPAQKMRDSTTGKIVVFVSRGRDAATMAHIMLQVVPKDRLEFVNLWYYPNLEYQQKQLAAWEKFFDIQIHHHPAEEVGAIAGGKQELRFGDVREWIRDKYPADFERACAFDPLLAAKACR